MQQRPHRQAGIGRRGTCLGSLLLAWLLGSALFARPALADDELDFGLERTRLARLEITGHSTFSTRELKQVLRLRESDWRQPLSSASYRPELVDMQLRQLRGWYRVRGFHQVAVQLDSVSVAADQGDILYISIDEGPRTMIDEVVFVGAAPLGEGELRRVMGLVEGQPSPPDINGLGEDIYRMRRLYWGRAHLAATITPELQIVPTATPARRSARVVYTIEPGPVYTVSRVDVLGELTTREELITREVRLRPGELFLWDDVDQTRQRLLQTALFRDVSLVAADWDTAAHQAALLIRVTERKPAFYELGMGFGSRERIRVLAAWGHNNLWGTGRRIQLRMRGFWNVEEIIGNPRSFIDGDLNYRADLFYSNPHLLGRSYPLEVNIFSKRETRGESGLIQTVTGLLVGTQRRDDVSWTNRLDLSLRAIDPEIHPLAPPDLQADFEAAGITATQTRSLIHSLFFEGRNDVFNPGRGYYFTSQLELAGGLIGGDNSFLKWSGSLQNYRRLLGGVLATRLRLGAVRPYGGSRELGSDGVPYDDRFFAGGAFSVRGYRENSLGPQITDRDELAEIGWASDVPLPDDPARGGNYQLITNIEWRFPLPLLERWNLSSVIFLDGGNTWEDLEDILIKGFRWRSYPGDPEDPASTKLWDYRYSVGTGLRLDTPFGPFRLDVGVPLKRARYQSAEKTLVDDSWRLHFSLGHIF
jgi:outer membrane protein insertion porin family